ncbi:MAG TPA: nickel pincer cofactor biosynthesis protein LarB [Candidatus Hydrogenedentes bacterium]|nr:nickel pincer cofactor biosynthesis protein LarB [Candidatus Hydrogenedentota bacterium]HPU96696.1 nickel pincer cofactor biosynthesis protein LarB [Candidatus Hydrogenedentota bacterium]
MNPERLLELLQTVASGKLSPADALDRLRVLPFECLDGATVDHHRELRKGHPEAIFCEGKTPEQVAQIAERLAQRSGGRVLGTRCDTARAEAARRALGDEGFTYHALARCFTLSLTPPTPAPGPVAVVCAGTSDLPVAEEAAVTLEFLGHPVDRVQDVGVAGLHRLLDRLPQLRHARVVIVCAGMEGALPSVVAGLVAAPVIGVPVSVGYGAGTGGFAALLGMLNSCATGLTVVNIDNGFGAAMAASGMLRMAAEYQNRQNESPKG